MHSASAKFGRSLYVKKPEDPYLVLVIRLSGNIELVMQRQEFLTGKFNGLRVDGHRYSSQLLVVVQ